MQHDPAQWKKQYDQDGYLVVEDAVDPALLAQLRDALDRITDNPRGLPPHLLRQIHFEQDYLRTRPHYNQRQADELGDAIRVIMELPLFDPVFERLILLEPQLDVLQTLFGSSEFAFYNYKCVVKTPRISSTFCWHRDLPYTYHSTPNLITSMICVDDMTEANGATVVMPGTHRLVGDEIRPQDADIPEADLPDTERVSVCCPAGSLVLFHVNIIHGGGPNVSPSPRRNVISIWTGPDTYPTQAKRYAHQGIAPRSNNAGRQRQTELAFAHLNSAVA